MLSRDSKNMGIIHEDKNAEYCLTLSSGGSQSYLASLGAILGCAAAGIHRFRMLGGVSAGSIVSALAGLGLNAVELVHMGLDLDFEQHLGFKSKQVKLSYDLHHAYEKDIEPESPENWRFTGLLGTERLGQCIHEYATAGGVTSARWPTNFWTMATTRNGCPVIFKADGVYLVRESGRVEQISDQPILLQDAIRMTCSIPGVFAAMRYKGMFLFDGALSRDGFCPVGIQIRHFGIDPRRIIACNLGTDSADPVAGKFHRICRGSWGVNKRWDWGEETTGVIEFRPYIPHIPFLKFGFSRDEKWLAILMAFESCLSKLALEGILQAERLSVVQQLFRELKNWRHKVPAGRGQEQRFSADVERIFTQFGLY